MDGVDEAGAADIAKEPRGDLQTGRATGIRSEISFFADKCSPLLSLKQ
jgi:hypothetical protein